MKQNSVTVSISWGKRYCLSKYAVLNECVIVDFVLCLKTCSTLTSDLPSNLSFSTSVRTLSLASMSNVRIQGDDRERMSERGGDSSDSSNMLVPASQMDNFLSTLKQYSAPCEANRKMIDEKVKDCISRMEKHKAACKQHSAHMEQNVKKMENI